MANVKLVVIGATGSGKTEVGKALAEKLGFPFVEGDDLHTASNIEKMSRGVPLSDEDREPWIANIIDALAEPNVVLGASLLKRSLRKRILSQHPDVKFVQLKAPMSVLAGRTRDSEKHFRQDLLNSQMVIMDPLRRDEPGDVYDATKTVDALVKEITFDLLRK